MLRFFGGQGWVVQLWEEGPGARQGFAPFCTAQGKTTSSLAPRQELQTCGFCSGRGGNSVVLLLLFPDTQLSPEPKPPSDRADAVVPHSNSMQASETAVRILIFLLSCNLSGPQTTANALLTHWETERHTAGLWATRLH